MPCEPGLKPVILPFVHLCLEFPDSWIVDQARRVARREPAIAVAWDELCLLPDDADAWQATTLGRDLPAGTGLAPATITMVRTVDGWPLRRVEADVLDLAGAVQERRMAAFYTFLEHGVAALARVNSTAAAMQIDELRAVLATGAPDWSGPVSSLAQLLDVSLASGELALGPWRAQPSPSRPVDAKGVQVLRELRVNDAGGRLLATFIVETSQYARERGAAAVLAIIDATGYRVIDVLETLPAPMWLDARVAQFLSER